MTRSQKQVLKLNRRFLDKNIKAEKEKPESTENIDKNAATSKQAVPMLPNEQKLSCTECLKQRETTNAMKVMDYVLNNSSLLDTEINELLNIPKLKSKVCDW